MKSDRYWETSEWVVELMSPIMDFEFATKQMAITEFKLNNKFNGMMKVQLPVNVVLSGL